METIRRSEKAMRKYLKRHLKEGRYYDLSLPTFVRDGDGPSIRKVHCRFEKLYPHVALFRTEKGNHVCLTFYETIHLIKGERYSQGIYDGMAETTERLLGLIPV